MHLPTLPLAGAGYLLPDIDGLAVFGASSQPGDADADVARRRPCLQPAATGAAEPGIAAASGLQPARLQGRVGWRCVADDRLPLVGAVPDEAALRQPGRAPGRRCRAGRACMCSAPSARAASAGPRWAPRCWRRGSVGHRCRWRRRWWMRWTRRVLRCGPRAARGRAADSARSQLPAGAPAAPPLAAPSPPRPLVRRVVGRTGAGLALGLFLQLLFLLLLLGQLALALFERVVGFGHGPSFR